MKKKQQRQRTILVVEDDPNDQILLRRAFQSAGIKDPIHILSTGAEAISYLTGEGEFADRQKYAFPATIITDLKMPLKTGFDVLRFLKTRPDLAVIPTIVLSGSADTDDVKQSYLAGAASYFVKPGSFEALTALVKQVYDYWKEAEVPEISPEGHLAPTDSEGKLGHSVLS